MKIIISPAKKMNVNEDDLEYRDLPIYLNETNTLLEELKVMDFEQLKALWKCNDKIAKENFNRINNMCLYSKLTPAILSYEGIAYQYMAPGVLKENELNYLQEHLRIISGFYGVLKPFDGVSPYRLEMQAKFKTPKANNLYDFWEDKIYQAICCQEDKVIVNLASKEYSKCVEKYLADDVLYVTITFCEKLGDKLVTKGTYAKMARGEMVRYMAEEEITDINNIKNFNRLNFKYEESFSNEKEFVFIRY